MSAGLLAVALSACGSPNWGFPYKANVQQGNWITSEQVAQLQPGMSREQVRYILGTPMLQDAFRLDRWDYPFFNKPGYGETQQRKFTVWFDGDSLTRWEGDEQPDRQPFQPTDTGMTPEGNKTAPEAPGASTSAVSSPDEQAPLTAPVPETSGAETGTSAAPALGVGGAEHTIRKGSATEQTQTGLIKAGTVDSIERGASGGSAPAHAPPIINDLPSSPSSPGVPVPGRDAAEPLR